MLIPEALSHLCDGFYSVSNCAACREPHSMKICRYGEMCCSNFHFQIPVEVLVCMCTLFKAANHSVHTSLHMTFSFNLGLQICLLPLAVQGSRTVHPKLKCCQFSTYHGVDGQLRFLNPNNPKIPQAMPVKLKHLMAIYSKGSLFS